MPRERINGVELYYEITGTDGPPLVLVHGSWGDHHNWDAVVPSLARSFRVLTYDRRGHSQSERPAGQGSANDDTADLAALIEAAGFASAHVAGNSGGSAVVLRLFVEDVAIGPGAWEQLPAVMGDTFVFNAPTFLDECCDPADSTMDLTGLGRFDRPALLTQGDQSPPMFARILDLVAKELPHADRKTIAGAGHVPHVSHAAAYVEIVTAFVRAAESG